MKFFLLLLVAALLAGGHAQQQFDGVYDTTEAGRLCVERGGCCCPTGPITVTTLENGKLNFKGDVSGTSECFAQTTLEAEFTQTSQTEAKYDVPGIRGASVIATLQPDGNHLILRPSLGECQTTAIRVAETEQDQVAPASTGPDPRMLVSGLNTMGDLVSLFSNQAYPAAYNPSPFSSSPASNYYAAPSVASYYYQPQFQQQQQQFDPSFSSRNWQQSTFASPPQFWQQNPASFARTPTFTQSTFSQPSFSSFTPQHFASFSQQPTSFSQANVAQWTASPRSNNPNPSFDGLNLRPVAANGPW